MAFRVDYLAKETGRNRTATAGEPVRRFNVADCPSAKAGATIEPERTALSRGALRLAQLPLKTRDSGIPAATTAMENR